MCRCPPRGGPAIIADRRPRAPSAFHVEQRRERSGVGGRGSGADLVGRAFVVGRSARLAGPRRSPGLGRQKVPLRREGASRTVRHARSAASRSAPARRRGGTVLTGRRARRPKGRANLGHPPRPEPAFAADGNAAVRAMPWLRPWATIAPDRSPPDGPDQGIEGAARRSVGGVLGPARSMQGCVANEGPAFRTPIPGKRSRATPTGCRTPKAGGRIGLAAWGARRAVSRETPEADPKPWRSGSCAPARRSCPGARP